MHSQWQSQDLIFIWGSKFVSGEEDARGLRLMSTFLFSSSVCLCIYLFIHIAVGGLHKHILHISPPFHRVQTQALPQPSHISAHSSCANALTSPERLICTITCLYNHCRARKAACLVELRSMCISAHMSLFVCAVCVCVSSSLLVLLFNMNACRYVRDSWPNTAHAHVVLQDNVRECMNESYFICILVLILMYIHVHVCFTDKDNGYMYLQVFICGCVWACD